MSRLGRPTVVESLPCLWEIKKLDPLEAILAASSPICSKGLAAATFRLTVSQPMSAPGHGFWPGRRPRASMRGVFLFLIPPWKPIGSWETGRTLRASNRSAPRFPLPTTLGLEKPFCQDRAAPPKGAPGGITFTASQFVFAGYSGSPFSNRAFNLRLRSACRALGVGQITAHGLRHSAATILLNPRGKAFARNPGVAPPQKYPHHRALHPRRL